MLRWQCQRLLTIMLSLSLFPTAQAATITVAPAASVYATPDLSPVFRTIRLTGSIEPGDANKLRIVLLDLTASATMPNNALIVAELNGTGGDYYEAMMIGYMFRDFRVATIVRKGDECLSACVLAFLGGSSGDRGPEAPSPRRYIEIGGIVGFRNYYSRPAPGEPAPNYPVQSLVDYSIRMGVEPSYRLLLTGLAPGKFTYIDTVEKFLVARTCPIGLGRSTATLAEQAANACSHALRLRDPDTSMRGTPLTASEARRLLLKYVQLHVWWLGVVGEPGFMSRGTGGGGYVGQKSGLASRLSSDEYLRNEEMAKNLYSDLKAAGLPLPNLTGTIFQVSAYLSSYDTTTEQALFSKVGCVVNLSQADYDDYDLVVQSQSGGTTMPALRSAAESCRGLPRRDRNEVINPVLPR